MKLNKTVRGINYILLLLVFVLQTFDNYIREQEITIPYFNTLKNLLLVAVPVLFLTELFMARKTKGLKYVFVDELKSISFLTIIFGVISLYLCIKNKSYEFETIDGLIRLMIPIIVAFFVVNVMSLEDIYGLMKKTLLIMFIGYLIAKLPYFNIENILAINFVKSHSVFEANFFSPAAISFCLFFCYFRKNKFYTLLSVIFTIMTFKRIMVIFSLFLLLFGGKIANMEKVKKKIIYLFIIGFIILSYVYIQLMTGGLEDLIFKYFNIRLIDFTMGRSFFMQVVLSRIATGTFVSTGFMSSVANFRTMEMDLPMIYVEMGFISVIATIYFMTKLAKDDWYCLFIILFCLLELLTSHWFDIVYFWIVAYITIGCIQYKKEESISYKKTKIKLIWN